MPQPNRRFLAAMASYALLALLAAFTLDGLLRLAVWVLLGGFAIKTGLRLGARR